MADYPKMYNTLFNAVTGALEHMEDLNFGMAKELLIHAQQMAEEQYMEETEA